MHKMILVVGNDVEGQMAELEEQGYCDWWAIGGRFRGCLPLKRGGKGKLYPPSVPNFEAAIVGLLGQVEGMQEVATPSAEEDGADQALVADVDISDVQTYALLRGGVLYDNPLSPKTKAILICKARNFPNRGSAEEEAQAECAAHEWRETMRARLRDLPPDTLLTAVDAHN